MTELEKIENAKSIISKLAKGINPIDNSEIPDGDLLNNVTIARCMFYVSDVLQGICDYLKSNEPAMAEEIEEPEETEELEEYETQVKRKKRGKKPPFTITPEQLNNYVFDNNPISIVTLSSKINALVDRSAVKKLKTSSITQWLFANEMINLGTTEKGTSYYCLTEKGKEIGIICELRPSKDGKLFSMLLYTVKAQIYILKHIEEIIDINSGKDDSIINNGKMWQPDQDEQLIELFNYGLELGDIAKEMKRTNKAIHARLVKLGLIQSKI